MIVDLYITDGWKYQVTFKDFKWKLLNKFTIREDYMHPEGYYSITVDGRITAYVSCCYNGPNAFPDVEWMMIGSLVHDILDWLIGAGIIPESENDLIDIELGDIVKLTKPPTRGWWGDKWRSARAWVITKATHFDSQKRVETQKPVKIYLLERFD